MLRNTRFLPSTILLLILFTFTLLLAAQLCLKKSAMVIANAAESSVQTPDPMAIVKTIVVGGVDKTEAAINEIQITHAAGGIEPGVADARLYFGDEITTGSGAQLTILFLDDAPDKDNEVLVDSNSRVRIGSIFSWLGRILVRCTGAFDTKTEKVRLGVRGTEFEVIVQPDDTNRVTVLEGSVSIEKIGTALLNQPGDTRPANSLSTVLSSSQSPYQPAPSDLSFGLSLARFIQTSFPIVPIPQQRLELTAVARESTTTENVFTFTNRCRNAHQYQIHGPLNLPWFRILGADRFEIAARQSKSITFALRMDTQQVPAGTYEGEIVARCLDCAQETSCDLAGALLPVLVRVINKGSGAGAQGSGTGGQGEQIVSAGRLQEVIVDRNGMRPPAPAGSARIEEAINWSNNVILVGQPTYSAQSVIPHSDSWTVRDQSFRVARREAIVRNDPNAYEILGDIYTDWGNGAKAVAAYNKIRTSDTQLTPDFYTDRAEALRLTGKLDEAEADLKRALALNPQWTPALNTLGNVQRDRARIAHDQGNYDAAITYLERARDNYNAAIKAAAVPTRHHAEHTQTAPRSTRNPQAVKAVALANLGDVFLEYGEIARERGQADVAQSSYQTAERAFRNASETYQEYGFAKTGLGDVWRASGNLALMRSDGNGADQSFARSQEGYRQALAQHRDMAEAFVGLGDVARVTGRKDEAIRNYLRAARLRPDRPEPHYRLAMEFADSNPRLAAEYAATYLKLEPKVFRNGEKARNAEKVLQGIPIGTPTPLPTFMPTSTPIPTPTPTSTSTPTGPLVKVPGLSGDRQDKAVAELRKLGLQPQVTEVGDCDASGKVLYSEPTKDVRVPQGSSVTVYVSTAGNDPATVPKVTGLSVEGAARELRNGGLNLRIGKKEETDKAVPDTVLKQKPDAFKKLRKGCEVEVTIAIPIPPVQVGNYIGMRAAEAEQAIFSDRLRIGEVREVDSRYPEGTVIDQFPKAGEVVPRGSRISLVVSRVRSTIVPNVVGLTPGQAQKILSSRGLQYQSMGGEAPKASNQEPAAGTRVELGTVVRVYFHYID